MKKDKLNVILREYVKNHLSPKTYERNNISAIYNSFSNLFAGSCYQVGSYPRFTSTSPVHDLDILFIAGDSKDKTSIDPSGILTSTYELIKDGLVTPDGMRFKLLPPQTHSIGVVFYEIKSGNEIISVDIVPAFRTGEITNDFGKETDIFWVPEVLNISKRKRNSYYKEKSLVSGNEEEKWIKSDPLGYIKLSTHINGINKDFRKAVKLIKKWLYHSKDNIDNGEFKLKSFHIEQMVITIIQENRDYNLFDIIFNFFVKLPKMIEQPFIRDRANASKFIDEYLQNLSIKEKASINNCRDGVLMALEDIGNSCNIDSIFCYNPRIRKSEDETYLFDKSIPVLTDNEINFDIRGVRLDTNQEITDSSIVPSEISISFRLKHQIENSSYLWKVKNSDDCLEPRGEIKDYSKRKEPESTKYRGDHFVECYSILGNECVGKSRRYVRVR